MRAVCWCGAQEVRVQHVSDPTLLDARDMIVKIAVTTICGSDLHLYGGFIPTMQTGDILGHEIVGEVVETGQMVRKFRSGDQVVVSSIIGCGQCWYCRNEEYSLCDNSNPNAAMMEKVYNTTTAGIFGYSHMFGGYAGAQAESLRVPFADVNGVKIPEGMTTLQALACSDAFPTGYMAADLGGVGPGVVVAVWGCGPVGQFVVKTLTTKALTMSLQSTISLLD